MRLSTGMSSGMLVAICILVASCVVTARAGDGSGFSAAAPVRSAPSARTVTPHFFPSYGGFGGFGFYGGYYSPFIDFSSMYTTNPYLPKNWWVERYPSADPRQSGYNPNSGYAREEVTTLLLETYPARARVILDGLFVGTSNNLGPMQLPIGMHTLRIEAAGFEPSQTVLNIEEPAMQQLEVRLKPAVSAAAK